MPRHNRQETTAADGGPGAALRGDGGMAVKPGLKALVEAFDWSRTALGPRMSWPQSLKLTVDLLLHAHVPMTLLSGRTGVMIYNDAYAALMGDRHPGLLGLPAAEAWPDAAASIDRALEAVFGGKTVSIKDQRYTLDRSGGSRPIWASLDCSPVFDENGAVTGCLAIVIETTRSVQIAQALRRSEERHSFLLALGDRLRTISDPLDMIAAAEEALGKHLGASRVGYGEVDATQRHFTVERNWTDGTVAQSLGEHDLAGFGPDVLSTLRSGVTLVVNDVVRDPRTATPDRLAAFAALETTATVTVTLLKQERLAAALYVHDREPREWTHAEIKLVEDVAERTWEALERSRTEAALRHSNERLRIAQRAGMIGTFEWYPASGRLEVSDEYRRIWGIAPDIPVTDTFLVSLVHPDDRTLTGPLRMTDQNPLTYAEYRILRADTGEQRWIARRGEVMLSREHNERRFVGVAFDITERKRSEAALKESEERFRIIANSAPVPMWVSGPDSRREFVNHAYCSFIGLPYEQAIAVDWTDILHPEDGDRILRNHAENLTSEDAITLEARFRRGDGQWRWLHSQSQPRLGPSGEHLGFIGVAHDVTDVREAQNALKRLNETLEVQVEQRTRERDLVWQNSNELMAVFGYDGYRKAINPAWSRLLGYDEETLLSLPFDEITHPEDVDSLKESIRALAAGKFIRQFEDRLRCADGSYRLISWTGIPGDGEFYAIGRDITEQRLTEDALRQSQKMEAVGQLTGGIAHDFNNLLTGITGSLDLLQRRLAAGRTQDVQRYIDAATSSAARAAALTHRLLAFARRQSLDTRPTDVNALVTSMEDLLRRTMGEAIAVETALDPSTWPALTDANQLESALLNLAINSRDAMPEGGRLRIETRNISFSLRDSRHLRGMVPGDYVALIVADTGSGMAADVKAKAFEPFFTTKPIGQGTGLGLSMIYGFIKQTKGYIQIDSEEGNGTTAILYLPRHAGEVEERADDGLSLVPLARQGETILLVEDDDAVRMLMADTLRELGYRVFEAIDARSALLTVESGEDLDLMVSDVGLPGGLNGRQLAELARGVRPGLKILFVTGYAEGAAIRGGFLDSGMEMIGKPFAIDDLAHKVRLMIGA
ncbi:PAS domain S-box protein [Microvirga pudoricolor]|uniref:PAS domain S-box protein n=1 Tax=Microvirga pudoricolor TaxID=2778729 RepID=UPI001951872D|nr:PAS domain S-box protein [Microvirga pudoricolor]MBM6592466.1 PAS domain S-box protein [Microvirga pudoricolor]